MTLLESCDKYRKHLVLCQKYPDTINQLTDVIVAFEQEESQSLTIEKISLEHTRLLVDFLLTRRGYSNGTVHKHINTIISAIKRAQKEFDAHSPIVVGITGSIRNLRNGAAMYAPYDKKIVVGYTNGTLNRREMNKLVHLELNEEILACLPGVKINAHVMNRFIATIRLYQLAVLTGLRFDDLASLTIRDFQQDTITNDYYIQVVQRKTQTIVKNILPDIMAKHVLGFVAEAKKSEIKRSKTKRYMHEQTYLDRSLFDLKIAKCTTSVSERIKIAIMKAVCDPGELMMQTQVGNARTHVKVARHEYFIKCHKMRHTLAKALILAGASIEDVSVQLGHSDTRTTQHYAKQLQSSQASQSNADKLNSILAQ